MNEKKSGNEKGNVSFEQKALPNGYWVVSVIGDLDMWSLAKAKEYINTLIQEQKVKLVLDLERTNYIDSSGLGFFIGTLKRLKEASGNLVIVNLTAYNNKIFELLQLHQIIPTYDTIEDAMLKV